MQNRAARGSTYVWLGNPAAAFYGGPPYIHRGPNHYQAPEGWIPLRLLNAARFGYVEIDGGLAAADNDRLFDPRIVIANDGNDKLVLFRHLGGEFRVRLAERPPWQRTIVQQRRWVIAGAALVVVLVLLLVLSRRGRRRSSTAS